MSVQSERCPSCGAPFEIPEHANQTKCLYCLALLTITRDKNETSINIAGKMADSILSSGSTTQSAIQEGTTVTQMELKRLQLAQDLSNTQLRLSNTQSEIRSLERTKQDRITQSQLKELKTQERSLKQNIHTIQEALNPVPTVSSSFHTMTMGKKDTIDPDQYSKGWLSMLLSFNGVISRKQYWLGLVIFMILISLGDQLSPVFSIPALWIFLAIHIKRYRAIEKSAWWAALWLVPFGLFWVIYELSVKPSPFEGAKE